MNADYQDFKNAFTMIRMSLRAEGAAISIIEGNCSL